MFAPSWAFPTSETGDFTETSPRNWGFSDMFKSLSAAAVGALTAAESAAAVALANSAKDGLSVADAVAAATAAKDAAIAQLHAQVDRLQAAILNRTDSPVKDDARIGAMAEAAARTLDAVKTEAARSLKALQESAAANLSSLRSEMASERARLQAALAAAQSKISTLEAAIAASSVPADLKLQLATLTRDRAELTGFLSAAREAQALSDRQLVDAKNDLDRARADLASATTTAKAADATSRAAAAAAEAKRLSDLRSSQADFEATCNLQLDSLRAQLAAKLAETKISPADADVLTKDDAASDIFAKTTDAAETPAHACSQITPTHIEPLFSQMSDVATALSSPMLRHFGECRTGLLAHYKRESGLRWNAITKEAAADGTDYPRYSYGLGQLLDDTLQDIYAFRARLGPYAREIKQLPKASPDGKPQLVTIAEINNPKTGAKYFVAHLINFEKWVGAFFDEARLLQEGNVVPKTTLDEKKSGQAQIIAEYVNSLHTANPDVDAVALLYRLFSGHGSLAGAANGIMKYRTNVDRSLGFLIKFSRELSAPAVMA